jgi:hypothetical protein
MLQPMFESARRFGLSEDAVWTAVDDAFLAVGRDGTVSEYLDELAAVLARRILLSERQASRSGGRARARRRD